MIKATASKDGLTFKLSEEIEVFFDRGSEKLKICKLKEIVNEVRIDPKSYTLTDLMGFLKRITDEIERTN